MGNFPLLAAWQRAPSKRFVSLGPIGPSPSYTFSSLNGSLQIEARANETVFQYNRIYDIGKCGPNFNKTVSDFQECAPHILHWNAQIPVSVMVHKYVYCAFAGIIARYEE